MWQRAPSQPKLDHHEVHVWRASLNLDAHDLALAWQTLSQDERERAQRLRLEYDQQRFVAARGKLRQVLGQYLECHAHELRFTLGPHGKPAVASATKLCFNLTHSQDWMLCAATRARAVGVDLERCWPELDVQPLMQRFAASEIAALNALPDPARRDAFFMYWTAKEAYLKARGEGLWLGLDRFAITVTDDSLTLQHDEASTHHWTLQRLEVQAGCVAALAVEGRDWTLRCWED